MISLEKKQMRLARRLYETGVMFAFALVIALVLAVGMSKQAGGRLTCATESIATVSTRCGGPAAPSVGVPSHAVQIVFASDASAAAFGR